MANIVVFGGPQQCSYRVRNPWNQPLGRISEYLEPFEIPSSYYVEAEGAQLVSRQLVGVEHKHKLIEETFPFPKSTWEKHLKLSVLSCLPSSQSVETALCCLVSPHHLHDSYFHWFLDYLPRLFAAEQYTTLTGHPLTVLVPTNLNEWQSASLSRLGYGADSLLPFNPGERFTNIKTRCLIASRSHRSQRAPGVPPDAISPASVAELKTRLSSTPPALGGRDLPKKLFLTRRDASSRRLINEHEVLSLLSGHGFEAVSLETVPLSDQIELFTNATHVVAVHGAGLTNLIHSHNASVLEIHSLNHGIRPEFFQIASLNHCQYFFYACRSQGIANDVYIDTTIINEFIAATC